jgi:hypothetical protein
MVKISLRKGNRYAFNLILAFFLALAPVYAQVSIGDMGIANALGQIGKEIQNILRNEFAVYGILVIICIILFNSIFKLALARVPLFRGDGAEGVSKIGGTVSICLSLLLTIFLFTKLRNSVYVGFITEIDSYMGVLLTLTAASLGFLASKKDAGEGEYRKPLIPAAIIIFLGYLVYKSDILLMISLILGLGLIMAFKSDVGGGVGNISPYKSKNPKPKRLRKWLSAVWKATKWSVGIVGAGFTIIGRRVKNLHFHKNIISRAKQMINYSKQLDDYSVGHENKLISHLRSNGDKDLNYIENELNAIKIANERENKTLTEIIIYLNELIKKIKPSIRQDNYLKKQVQKISHNVKQLNLEPHRSREILSEIRRFINDEENITKIEKYDIYLLKSIIRKYQKLDKLIKKHIDLVDRSLNLAIYFNNKGYTKSDSIEFINLIKNIRKNRKKIERLKSRIHDSDINNIDNDISKVYQRSGDENYYLKNLHKDLVNASKESEKRTEDITQGLKL